MCEFSARHALCYPTFGPEIYFGIGFDDKVGGNSGKQKNMVF